MQKKLFLSFTLLTLVLTGCGGGDKSSTTSEISSISEATSEITSEVTSEITSEKPEKHYSDGRIVELVEDEDHTGQTLNSDVYINGTLPLTSGGTQYGGEVADPHIVRGDDGMFYCFATNLVALKSEDATNWEVTNAPMGRPTWGDKYASNPGIWAPDSIKIKDKFVYYYSVSAWGNAVGVGVAVADDAGGPYKDMGKLFRGAELGISNCIDPAIFIEDGEVFLSVGSFQGIYLVQLTDDGLGLYFEGTETKKDGTPYESAFEYWAENKVCIAGRDGSGWDGSTYEGTYIVKRGEYYYLFGSVGTCCDGKNSSYQVWAGRATNVWGPYVDKKGRAMTMSGGGNTFGEMVLWSGIDTGSGLEVYGPGHNSLLIDDLGQWWIYYHGYFKADNYRTRHLMMDKIIWEDDYPVVAYENEEGKIVKKKPSYDIELEGPSFYL